MTAKTKLNHCYLQLIGLSELGEKTNWKASFQNADNIAPRATLQMVTLWSYLFRWGWVIFLRQNVIIEVFFFLLWRTNVLWFNLFKTLLQRLWEPITAKDFQVLLCHVAYVNFPRLPPATLENTRWERARKSHTLHTVLTRAVDEMMAQQRDFIDFW